MTEDDVVKVFTAQMGVSVSGFDFKDSLLDFEDGDVKGPAPQVVHCNDAVSGLVEAESESRGSWLVDDA